VQGDEGTLFGVPYATGSWQDKLIEAFAGTHDFVGGKLSGLYDEQGNATRGGGTITRKIQDTWSATGAIAVSTPFAAAQGLPPDVWKAIAILLKAAR
jgi:filamentous hemagglutinin